MDFIKMMDDMKQSELEFKISPDAGFIKVSIINTKGLSLKDLNFGWYSFRDHSIECLLQLYEGYLLDIERQNLRAAHSG